MRLPLYTAVLVLSLLLPAQDLSPLLETYARMQALYTGRAEGIEKTYQEREREEVQRVIVRLVRVEQAYREDGDLEGVLQARNLQSALLEHMTLPGRNQDFMERIAALLSESRDKLNAHRAQAQSELDALNRGFAERVEPVMRDLTRAGDFTTAREILALRNEIFESLNIRQAPLSTARTAEQLSVGTDSSIVPLNLEPPGFQRLAAHLQRQSQIPFQLKQTDGVEISPRAFLLQGGRLTIPAHATEALIHQIQQTGNLTLEIGFQTQHIHQHGPILCFGSTPADAQLVLQQEGPQLVLILQTQDRSGGPAQNRVPLGALEAGRMNHLVIVYRPGDLAVFRNGGGTRRNRGDASGEIRHWRMQPVHLGQTEEEGLFAPAPAWQGSVILTAFRSTLPTPRNITQFHERFVGFASSP